MKPVLYNYPHLALVTRWAYWNRYHPCIPHQISETMCQIHSYVTWALPRIWEWCSSLGNLNKFKFGQFLAVFVFENILFFSYITVCTKLDLKIHTKFHQMLGDHSLGPGNDTRDLKFWKISIWLIFRHFRVCKYTFFHNCKYVPCRIAEIIRPNFVKCYMIAWEWILCFLNLEKLQFRWIFAIFMFENVPFFHNCKYVSRISEINRPIFVKWYIMIV